MNAPIGVRIVPVHPEQILGVIDYVDGASVRARFDPRRDPSWRCSQCRGVSITDPCVHVQAVDLAARVQNLLTEGA